MTPTETEALRRAAVDRVGYLLRLADALEARHIVICGVAALELRTLAEGFRHHPHTALDLEGPA